MALFRWLAVLALGTIVLSPAWPLTAAEKRPCCCHGTCPLAAKPSCHKSASGAASVQIVCPGCSGTEVAAAYFLQLGVLPAAVRLAGLSVGPQLASKAQTPLALLPSGPLTPPPKPALSSSPL